MVVQYFIPTPQAQLNQEQQNPASWQSMNGAQSCAALQGEKAPPEMTVFNLAETVGSSWLSCLLSHCGH